MTDTVRLVPTWEAAARIFTNNLMHGKNVEVQYKSADELVKMGKLLDRYIICFVKDEQKEVDIDVEK